MRKTKAVIAPDFCGRDRAKHFYLIEWPAATAEKWALRAILAYNRNGGAVLREDIFGLGMEGIFLLGMNTFLRGQIQAEEIIPILDELLECVRIIRDPSKKSADTGEMVTSPIVSDDDIEETATRMWLRSEVFELHTGFSAAGAVSKLIGLITTPANMQES